MTTVMELLATLGLDSSAFEKSLKSAKDSANSTGNSIGGKMSSIGSAIGGGLKTMAKAGAVAVGAATGAVTAFGASAIKVGMDFDSSMSQVAATMGLTMNEMQDQVGTVDLAWGTFSGNLRDYAQEMGANTAFSAKQAADALNYMALAGYDVQTSMEMLPNVLNLAAAGGMELATASDMVTDASSALGLSMEETKVMVDQMAMASSKSNTSVAQLGEAILTVGGTAKDMAGGTQELSTALGILANAGVKGAEGGTALRNILLSLTPKSEEAGKAMDSLGFSAYDAEGNMRPLNESMRQLAISMADMSTQERQTALASMFNKVDLKSVNALMAQCVDGVDKLSYALASSSVDWESYSSKPWMAGENAMQKFAEQTRYILQDMGGSVEEATNFLTTEYDMTAEDARAAVETVNNALAESGSTWDALSESIGNADGAAQKMADTQLDNLTGDITLLQSAFEGLQIAISETGTGSLRDFVQLASEGLSNITKGFKEDGLSGAMDAFGDMLTKGLKMIVDEAPQFIDAGMQLLGALGQGIIDNIPTIVDSTVQIVAQLADGLVQAVPQLAEGAITLVSSLGQALMDNSPKLMETGMQLLDMISQGITEGVPKLIEQGLPMLVEFSAKLRENAGNLVDAGIDLIMKLADGLIDGLPTMIETIPDIVINIAGIINDNAPKLLVAGVELIAKLAMGIVKSIPTLVANIPKIFQAILAVWSAFNWINLGTQVITFIGNGIKSLSTAIPNTIKDIGTKAFEFFKGIQWGNLGQTVINLLKGGITGLASAIPTALKAIGTAAVNAFKGIDWLGVGKNIISGIIKGVTAMAGAAVNAVVGVGKKMVDGAKSFLGIHSPSRLMADAVGQYIPEGIAVGIDRHVDSVMESMRNIADLVSEPITPSVGEFSAMGAGALLTAGNAITINVYGAQGQDVEELAEIVSNKINNLVASKRRTFA